MAYQQLTEILRAIDEAHRQVRDYCCSRDFKFGDSQQEMLSRRLLNDQQRIRHSLRHYLHRHAEAQVLRIWIQYIPEKELFACVADITRLQCPTFEELIDGIHFFYREVAGLIERVGEQTLSVDAKTLLADLALQEEQNAKALSAGLTGLLDT